MITERALRKQVQELGENGKVFVGDRTGMYVRRRGNSFTWQLQYQNKQGRLSTKSFGRYPDVSLKDARLACAEFRVLLAGGNFPEPNNQKSVKRISFEVLAAEWKEQKMAQKSKNWAKQAEQVLKSAILPEIGNRDIHGISKSDLIEIPKAARECEFCGSVYVPRTWEQRFCRESCRRKGQDKDRREQRAEMRE